MAATETTMTTWMTTTTMMLVRKVDGGRGRESSSGGLELNLSIWEGRRVCVMVEGKCRSRK